MLRNAQIQLDGRTLGYVTDGQGPPLLLLHGALFDHQLWAPMLPFLVGHFRVIAHDHFGEVTFEDAFVPEERLIGSEGQGWQQVIAELGLERSGPERFLSSFELLRQLAGWASEPEHEVALGSLYARLSVLRQMSLSVAARLSRGEEVGVEASVVKELGTTFEQSLPHVIHDLLGTPVMRQGGDTLMQVHAVISQLAPSYSLRGGTREILRGIIAKDLLQ